MISPPSESKTQPPRHLRGRRVLDSIAYEEATIR